MIIEVIGHKGVVGSATHCWLKAMHPGHHIIGRDKGDNIPNHAHVSFVCVPESAVLEVCEEAASYADLIVIRSTVTPGTCRSIQSAIGKHVVHNPEFLKEATAVQDVFNPSFILLGTCCYQHSIVMRQIYDPARCDIVICNTITSELTKIAINNYLACLVSFWNEIESIAQVSGASGHRVGAIASHDPRVIWYGSRYHHQYGGKCLPKEIDQMIGYARGKGLAVPMLEAIKEVNRCQPL